MHGPVQHTDRFTNGALFYSVTFLLLSVASTAVSDAWAQAVLVPPQSAQPSARMPSASSPVKSTGALRASSKPAWQDLTPLQQTSLKPLAANWNTLRESQKRKWIAIAANYPKLTPTEQETLHSRMTEWASLSEQQRAQARLNFAQSKQLTPSQKTSTWNAYQALSPEEKQKLATAATPQPASAATALKPVPPKKLAVVPVTRQTQNQTPKMAAASHAMDRNTLLPQAMPPLESASAQRN